MSKSRYPDKTVTLIQQSCMIKCFLIMFSLHEDDDKKNGDEKRKGRVKSSLIPQKAIMTIIIT